MELVEEDRLVVLEGGLRMSSLAHVKFKLRILA